MPEVKSLTSSAPPEKLRAQHKQNPLLKLTLEERQGRSSKSTSLLSQPTELDHTLLHKGNALIRLVRRGWAQ
eukprot:3018533-Amphidinium_carterae.1